MAQRLISKPVVAAMATNMSARVDALVQNGIQPTLAIVRVGNRPDDLSYERTATKRAESLGVAVKPYVLDEFVPQLALQATLQSISYDTTVHGCLMFRPLPSYIDETLMCDQLTVGKDVDGISQASLAGVFCDAQDVFAPCTAEACVKMLEHYNIPITGKHVVVVGRSLVIGKPVAMMLLRKNASVTICHSKSENLADMCKSADIVICATGRARAFDSTYFSKGQTVLDVGINFDTQGNLCGDVDFESVEPVVANITPVPGGIGSVTTSVTMEHTIRAAERSLADREGSKEAL